ncbi:MAG: HPr family phosphocarrier protein [Caldilineaceae bacterium]|nr:HPr family phosphocarrier protein [Caldilineaceae bacterium]
MDKPEDGARPASSEPKEHSATVTVNDPQGLHLRTSKDVVRVANQYQAEITARNLSRASGQVDVKSILQLMQLQARQGHVLLLQAAGPDAADALDALCSLFHRSTPFSSSPAGS